MIQWFKHHPQFLRDESTALSNNSNYKEIAQCRDNLFISHGNIIVRYNGTHRFPILIIYTDATPYRLPIVFPLKETLTLDIVKELASLKLHEAVLMVRPLVKQYFNVRHQNNSGELCILERDELDAPSSIYSIRSIIQRIRDWCAGHITGNFPQDSEEVEFEAHFNAVNQDIKLFYSNNCLDTTFQEGDFYAYLYKMISKARLFQSDQYIYSGFFIDGISKGLDIASSSIDLSELGLHENIKTSHDLYLQAGVVSELIDKRFVLRAHWFHIENEPSPFEKLPELVTIIGNGNYTEGIRAYLSFA